MRTFRILNFVLGTCLVAAMALTAQAEAQAGITPQAAAYFEINRKTVLYKQLFRRLQGENKNED